MFPRLLVFRRPRGLLGLRPRLQLPFHEFALPVRDRLPTQREIHV